MAVTHIRLLNMFKIIMLLHDIIIGTLKENLSLSFQYGITMSNQVTGIMFPREEDSFDTISERQVHISIQFRETLLVHSTKDWHFFFLFIQCIPLIRNPDNGDFWLFATFHLALILFPFRQCKNHLIIWTLIKDIFGLLQQKSSHRLDLFLFISNFGTYGDFK